MNLEDIDFTSIVEVIQEIKWPSHTINSGFLGKLADLSVGGSRVKPAQLLTGLLLTEFFVETFNKVYGHTVTDEIMKNGDDANIKIVLEEAHPDLMRGILAKIKNKILTEVTEEQWDKYGGY